MSEDVRKVATYIDMSQQFIDALPTVPDDPAAIAGALADGGEFTDVDDEFAQWVREEIEKRHGGPR